MSENKTMLFELSRPQQFLNLLGCIEAINEKCTLDFTAEGIKVNVMDTSHVALVNLVIQPDNFDAYSYWIGKVSLNLTDALKVLGKVTKDDELQVYLVAETKTLAENESPNPPKFLFVIRHA